MGTSEFGQLVGAFCKQASIANKQSIISGNAFSIHGRLAWLQYLEHADQCRLILDLGQPKGGIPSSLLRMMLEFNCGSDSRYFPSIGIHPKNGNALLMLHPPMAVLRRESSLFELLHNQLKPVSEAWRTCLDALNENDSESPVLLDLGFA